ncbi:MAG: AAA family ATPase [Lachnospiraceae bacterium]|nr:AAA family ATPase [Lachnospiraceae bacterium]
MGKMKKATVSGSSVGADVKQSLQLIRNEIISKKQEQSNLQAAQSRDFNGKNADSVEALMTISMSELYDTCYAPKLPIVDGLIYPGTFLFVGAPKVGKSFFMAQLGYHVSMGIPLWDFPVRKGTVLYLALEDDYARLQKRLSRMFGVESSENFYFATHAKSLQEGLEQQLDQFVREHSDARLIIIDTLQKVREVSGDKFSYANDYEIVAKLKEFSDLHGICLLVVHHTRKMESSDTFDMISGTNGLLGAADGAFVMQKEKRTENKAVLEVTGRDQQDQRLSLEFDREQCLWKLQKMETELWKEPVNPLMEKVKGIVSEEHPVWQGTATELLGLLQEPDLHANTLSRKLNTMAEQLLLEYGIRYEISRDNCSRWVRLTLLERNQ